MKFSDIEKEPLTSKPTQRGFENIMHAKEHFDQDSPRSPNFKENSILKSTLELRPRRASVGELKNNMVGKVEATAEDSAGLAKKMHEKHDHIRNGEEEYRRQFSPPATEEATNETTYDLPQFNFNFYSNNTTDWGALLPSNRINQLRQEMKVGGYGLMSLSIPLPSISGTSQNEQSMFIAELYVCSQ